MEPRNLKFRIGEDKRDCTICENKGLINWAVNTLMFRMMQKATFLIPWLISVMLFVQLSCISVLKINELLSKSTAFLSNRAPKIDIKSKNM